MTKTDIEKFVNPNTGRLSTRIKSYTDLSIEELYCIYNEIEKDENIKFISFTKGYSKNFTSNYILDNKNDLIKYKDLLITKSGRLETNKLCQVKFNVKEIYDTIYKKGICKKCNKETNFISFSKGYSKTCNHCNNIAGGIKARQKSIKTNIEKYGVDHPMKNKNIVNKKVQSMTINGIYNNNSIKAKETEISKYGCAFQKTEKYINSRKTTCMKKYGVENPLLSKSFRQTMINSGKWVSDEERSLVEIYYKEVGRHTYKNITKIPNIEKRGQRHLNEDAYEIDHKFSIIEGYKNNIPPYIIGDIANLEMLHWKDNANKSSKCSITLNELLSSFDKSRFI